MRSATTNATGTNTDTNTTGPNPTCDAGLECLPVPMGWVGPFAPEFGTPGQCDDNSLSALFVGTIPAWNGECGCNCGASNPVTCNLDFLVGGDPNTCADNTEIGDTCTSNVGGGPITCTSTPMGCYQVDGERVSSRTYHACTPGVGSILQPSFVSGYRMCDADEAVGSPCEGGQCADAMQPLCIYAQADVNECPPSFPNRTPGFESFSAENVACECRCEDLQPKAAPTRASWTRPISQPTHATVAQNPHTPPGCRLA